MLHPAPGSGAPARAPGLRRRAIAFALLLATALPSPTAHAMIIVNGQPVEDTPPAAGFVVPKVDTKTIDKLDDLDRFIAKKAWELAFRIVNQIDVEGKGMAPSSDTAGQKGFLFPVSRRVSESLLHLSPEGRDSYRLFNDASAKQLWDKLQNAKSPANPTAPDEIATLQKIVDQYFLTAVGDLAADRLGDALLEQGNPAAALNAWDAILDKYPDPHTDALKIQVKRAAALAQLHRHDELTLLAATLKTTYPDQKVTIGGQEISATTFVDSLLKEPPPEPTTMAATQAATQSTTEPSVLNPQFPPDSPIALTSDTPSWQIRVTSFNAAERMEQQTQNWGGAVHFVGSTPPAAADDKRLYVNWFGVIYAADLHTGKMLWRTSKFNDIATKATVFPQYGVSPDHFAISCFNNKVFTLGFDSQNVEQPGYQLQCLDAATGKLLWKAASLGSVQTIPFILDGTGYVLAIVNNDDLQCIPINLDTGKPDSPISLGKPQGAPNNYNGQAGFAAPAHLLRGTTLYVATNNGALLAVDLPQHRLLWAFQNDTKPIDTSREYWGNMPRSFETPCTLLEDAGIFYLKDTAAPGLYALDPDSPKLQWRRTVSSEETVVAVQNQTAFLLGQYISALDLKTKKLLWATKIPLQTGQVNALVLPDHIYVATQRGIYDIDPANGDMLHIFRGADHESSGGRLLVAGNNLICITDSAVTAYPIQRTPAHP